MYVCCPWLLRRRHLSQCRFNVVGGNGILNENRIFSKRPVEYVAAENEIRSSFFFHSISLHNPDNTLFIFMFIINSNFSLSPLVLLLLLLLWLEVYAYIDYCLGAYRAVSAWVLWKLLLFNSILLVIKIAPTPFRCIFYLCFINKKNHSNKNHEYNNK